MSMPKLNAPAEIHWRRSNMNTRDPILMKSVEVLKDCRSLNAAAEMNCPMPRSVEKVPIRNEKRCIPCDCLCTTVLHISLSHVFGHPSPTPCPGRSTVAVLPASPPASDQYNCSNQPNERRADPGPSTAVSRLNAGHRTPARSHLQD